MRISDWSSDVCSSDLRDAETGEVENGVVGRGLVDFKRQLTDNTAIYNAFLVESGSDNTFLQNDIGIAVAMNEKFALKARSEEHTSELQSLMRISYAVFCLKNKKNKKNTNNRHKP